MYSLLVTVLAYSQEHTSQPGGASAAEFYFRDLAESADAQNAELQQVANLGKF